MNQRMFAFMGELPAEVLPLVVGLKGGYFAVWRSFCALPRVNHVEGVALHCSQSIPCEWEVNLQEDGHELA